MNGRSVEVTRVGVPTSSGTSSGSSAAFEPRNCPATATRGDAVGQVESENTDEISFAAWGAQSVQAASACSACAHGHSTRKVVTVLTGCALKRNEVTTPKLPPPPPRQAQ